MFEEEMDNKIYNLLIPHVNDKNNEYNEFVEKLYTKKDFLWKESMAGSYSNISEDFFKKIDAIIILSGLYEENKENIDLIIKEAEKNKKPIILVRPYGTEEVPENLEKIADGLVGWNANCIIDTIKGTINNN